MPRTKAELEKIDRLATEMYDRENPQWQVKIRISKQACIDRVIAKLNVPAGRTKSGNKRLTKAERAMRPVERSLIRAAFDLVRDDPAEAATTEMLRGALGGKFGITETLLQSAQEIISARGNQ